MPPPNRATEWLTNQWPCERREQLAIYCSSQTGKEPRDGPVLQMGWERLRGEVRPTWAEPTGNNRFRTDMLTGSSGHWCKGHRYLKPAEDCAVRSHLSQGFGAYRSPEKHHGKGWAVYRTAQECSQWERKKYKDFLYRKPGFRAEHNLGATSLSIYLPPGIQSKPSSPPKSLFSAHHVAVAPRPGPDLHASASRHSAPALGSWAFTWVTGWLRHTGSGLQGLNPRSALTSCDPGQIPLSLRFCFLVSFMGNSSFCLIGFLQDHWMQNA